jgi:hypothetical protein
MILVERLGLTINFELDLQECGLGQCLFKDFFKVVEGT